MILKSSRWFASLFYRGMRQIWVNKDARRGDARQRSACFVPAGARERSGLRVIVSGFLMIAREEREREVESAAEINKGREREKAEIRIPPRGSTSTSFIS